MTIVTVSKVGRYGIIQDPVPHTLPPEAWSDGVNFRFRKDTAERVTGEEGLFQTPSVAPRYVQSWIASTTWWIVYASEAKIYRMHSTSNEDITRLTGGDYNGDAVVKWTGGSFGGVLILNNDSLQDYPQMWDGSANMQNLTNWPANTYVKVFRFFKQFCIGLHVTDATGTYPTKIMWSDTADPGTVPTTWTPAGTNLAGDYTFSESPGAVLDGLALGDLFVIYKEDSTWLMRVSQGAFVFESAQAFRTLGILSVDCAVEFEKKHFVVTRGDVIIHDGTNVTSIIDDLNRDWLFDNIDGDYYAQVQVVADSARSEIWIGIPTVSSEGDLTYALIWNWRSKTWAKRELTGVRYLNLAVLQDASNNNVIDYYSTTLIDDGEWAINLGESVTTRETLIAGKVVNSTYAILQMNISNKFDGTAYEASLERTGLAIAGRNRDGSVAVDPTTVKYLREVYPRIEAAAGTTVQFQFGYQMHFDEDVTWLPTQDFVIGTDRKLDVDMSFCFLGIRFFATEAEIVKLDGYDMDLELIGRY